MMIKVVILSPRKRPQITEIEDDLFEYQRIVDGNVEAVPIGKNLTALVNEDGKMLGLSPNFSIGYLTVLGNAIVVRDVGDVGYKSLTSKQIDEAVKIFEEGKVYE